MIGRPRWNLSITTCQAVRIPTDDGFVAAAIHLPEKIPAPVVICCHGLLSHKDSAKFISIAEQLSLAGMAAVRFDFSGCGETSAALKESLLSSRIRDLEAVVRFAREQAWSNHKFGLLGSSLGGYLALDAAARYGDLIRAVVCWATPFDLKRIKLALEETRMLEDVFPAGFRLGEPESLEHLGEVSKVLIIHGQEDETVPWSHAGSIYKKVGYPKRLVLLKDADHRLLDPWWRQLAIKLSLRWFEEYGWPHDGPAFS